MRPRARSCSRCMFDPNHLKMLNLNSLVALLRSLHITLHRHSPAHSMYFSTLGLCWRFGVHVRHHRHATSGF